MQWIPTEPTLNLTDAFTTSARRERHAGDLDLFRVYLDQAGRHPLLTRQEEVELNQAYRLGLDAQGKLADCADDDPARPDLEATAERGEWARRKMIESNLRLVVSIARRFSATGLPLGDLVQEGNLGLLRAVEKFDWRKGFKFSTYATWWIRQAIARGAADRGARAIRLPVHVDEQVGRLRRTQTRLHERLGHEPTRAELAAELHLPTDRVAQLADTAQAVTSLDTPVGQEGAALRDFLHDAAAPTPRRPGRLRPRPPSPPPGPRQPPHPPTPGPGPALRAGLGHSPHPRGGRVDPRRLPRTRPPARTRWPVGTTGPGGSRPPGRPRRLVDDETHDSAPKSGLPPAATGKECWLSRQPRDPACCCPTSAAWRPTPSPRPSGWPARDARPQRWTLPLRHLGSRLAPGSGVRRRSSWARRSPHAPPSRGSRPGTRSV